MKLETRTTLRILLTTCCVTCVLSRPQSYGRDLELEGRFLRRKGNRGGGQPCASFNRPGKGRTFFDWPVQHYDITYNYHYNVNCGGGSPGGGGGGFGGHPVNVGGGGGHPVGVATGGPHPINVGGGQIGGGLLGHKKNKLMNILTLLGGSSNHVGDSPSQIQSQTQNLIANFGHLGQGILGTVFPENGLFDGQLLDSIGHVGSNIGNHLSFIFNSPSSSSSGGGGSGHPVAGGGGQNPLGGILGGIFNGPSSSGGGGGNGGSGNPAPVQTTTEDPDDIIYNDEKPVYEPPDEVTELYSNNFRPSPRPSPRPRPGYYPNRYQAGNGNRYQQNSFYNEKFIGPQNYNRRYY